MNELKNRGVGDVLIAVVEALAPLRRRALEHIHDRLVAAGSDSGGLDDL
jgi:hypothetical protein